MVDRITPATLPVVAEELRDRYGVDDMWPVICEDFALWVIEDNFPCGRPAWERATTGKCLFVEDVLPYELMKLRLLNGAHQAIAYTGLLLGHRKVHDAMSDEAALAYLTAYMDAVAKTCPTVPGISLEEWQVGTRARFANPAVEDQLLRLAEDARNRIQVAVVPCLVEASALRPVAMLIACWLRYIASSRDELGAALEAAPDPAREGLEPLARGALNSADEAAAARFLAEAFGTESLGTALAGEVAGSLQRIGSVGLRAALAEF